MLVNCQLPMHCAGKIHHIGISYVIILLLVINYRNLYGYCLSQKLRRKYDEPGTSISQLLGRNPPPNGNTFGCTVITQTFSLAEFH